MRRGLQLFNLSFILFWAQLIKNNAKLETHQKNLFLVRSIIHRIWNFWSFQL